MQAVTAAPASISIAALCGSLRGDSFNRGLLRAAMEISKDIKGLNIEYVDIAPLPFLNTDLEVDGTYPPEVEAFRQKISKADGVLFASPEYNYSVTGPLKNAIDWGSRDPNVWADKTAAIVSAGGNFGGGRSQYHLRQSGVYLDLHFINKPEFFLRAFEPPPKFDSDGNLLDAAAKERLKEVLLSLQAFTLRLQRSEKRAMEAAGEAGPSIKVAAICGSLRKGSYNRSLIRAAIGISKESVKGIIIEEIDISSLPFLNTDLEVDGVYPAEVEAFRKKIRQADSILFASPEYNYSVSGPLKNAIDWASRPPNVWAHKTAALTSAAGGSGGVRQQYHLRQIGVFLDIHFINKPEFFLRRPAQPPSKFDSDGNLIDLETKEKLKEVLSSLYAFTVRLQGKSE